jgi:hypothetical protein
MPPQLWPCRALVPWPHCPDLKQSGRYYKTYKN